MRRQRRPRISSNGKNWLIFGGIIAAGLLARPSPAVRFGPSPQFEELIVGGRGSEHFVALRNSGLASVRVLELRLTGDAAGDFVSSANDCTNAALSPGRSCIVGLTFIPHREGRRNAELTVFPEGGVLPARLILTGLASARNDFRVEPPRIEFSDQPVGNSSNEHRAEVTSVARTSLQLASPQILGDSAEDFDLGNNSCSGALPPRGNCFVEVRFRPRVAGERNAWLELHEASGGATHEIPLVGRGTVGDLFVDPELVQFPPTQMRQTSEVVSVLVRSSGALTVQVGAITLGGPAPGDFHVDKGYCESTMLHPNVNCQMTIQFQPMALGLRTATVSLMDNSADGPHVIHLQGIGTDQPRPSAQIYARTYSFGQQRKNTTTGPLRVFVFSRGAAPLGVGTVAFSSATHPEFWLETHCSQRTLRANEHCEIDVYFRPTAVGDFRARVAVPHNASNAPNYFDVDGAGIGVRSHLVLRRREAFQN